jgi:hypothetical protein
MSLPVPEKIELKLAIVPEDTAEALSKLGLSDPPREEKRIHFFDTEGLLLFDRGLILRVRQTVAGGDPDDATVKVRGPGAPDAAERFLAAATGDAKYEGDQNVGRLESPSFSITTKPVSAALTSILAGDQELETVLDDTGKTLLREIKGADPAGITCLGPIRSRSWKLKPPGFSGKVTAELWDLADVSLLEISDKAPRAAAAALAAQLIGLLAGTDIRQLDSSKTRFALERLHPKSLVQK